MPNNTPYRPSLAGWRMIDKIQAFLLAVLIPTMMVISVVNLQSLIENSYQPVFINAPWKAWAISLLAPCASICLDMLPKAFKIIGALQDYRAAKLGRQVFCQRGKQL